MSDKIDDGGPAFARTGNSNSTTQDGMTLLDYSVVKFLSSQIVYEGMEGMEGVDWKHRVACAHEIAAAMLAEKRRREQVKSE